MTLSPAFLDELRARTTLSGLVGRTVKLARAGREFKACCPFHNEKTASFYVNDEKGFYHCFGCQAHGDAIRWLTDQSGLAFMDAVKELADAEAAEVAVIEGFLPAQMDEAELAAAIDAIVAETGAASVKDMGRVMALLRERHAGDVEMGKASAAVKARLSA